MTTPRDPMLPAGVVLTVMGLTSAVLSALPAAYTHASGFGDGEGQGDLGAGKLYLASIVQGSFLALGLVLLAGALACLVIALVRRRVGP